MIATRWQQWRRLSAAERIAFAQASAMVPLMALTVRVVGFKRLHAWIERTSTAGPTLAPEAQSLRRCVVSVHRTGRYAPYRGNCLSQSLTLIWLLRRHGLRPTLRLGVKVSDAKLDAHAWVELNGRVLNDTQDVHTRFTPFASTSGPQ
ncbi:MAG: lasso peptide biosynthesis B2 protein [Acidobacteria bacterium]|nr:lasso peptide biosynthesis B2 protein [Acidobacteriota bacterium]